MSADNHELLDFMRDATTSMATEYARIQKRATEDPGTAGDQGEENWATLLRQWLPHTYHVVTKGRILGHGGSAGPQVDVLVLSPAYPRALIDKKLFLAGGVLAAFECKLTLKTAHIRDMVHNAVQISRLEPRRTGAPALEMHSPIIYGLLAHAHIWDGPASTPASNIETALLAADKEFVEHPSEMPHLLCVANLGLWVKQAITWVGPELLGWSPESASLYGDQGCALTSYLRNLEAPTTLPWPGDVPAFSPIGAMMAHLLLRLAHKDAALRELAVYFLKTGLGVNGLGPQRRWPIETYSSDVQAGIRRGRVGSGSRWDDWAIG